MKARFLALLMAFSTLSFAAPRTSEAGLLLTGAGGVMWLNDLANDRSDRVPDDLRLMLYGGGVTVLGGVLWLVGAKTWGVVTLVLDELGSASPEISSLEAALSRRFPAIEDRSALRRLAHEITRAGPVPAEADSARVIRLPAERVLEILAPSGLAESDPAQLASILEDLG